LCKSCHIHSDTSWKSSGRYPSIWTCGHLWVARKPTLHRLDGNIVCCRWFHGWNHDWLADDLPLNHQMPFNYSVLAWTCSVFSSLWVWVVAPSFCIC
jgi:hypothetical protein